MAIVFVSLIVGLLIGAVGIGGVLLVPALSLIADIGVHEAIPACMLSYLATGAVGVMVYSRHGSIQWPLVGWLCLGAIPAAYLGSVSLLSIPASAVMTLIAVLMIFAGGDALVKSFRQNDIGHSSQSLGAMKLVMIGAITGFWFGHNRYWRAADYCAHYSLSRPSGVNRGRFKSGHSDPNCNIRKCRQLGSR